jgi:hypothetical protein
VLTCFGCFQRTEAGSPPPDETYTGGNSVEGQSANPVVIPIPAKRYDFNADGYPDLVLITPITGQSSPLVDLPPLKTAIWYLQNNQRRGPGSFGPEFSIKWVLVDAADFNKDGHTDFVMFNRETSETKILYNVAGALVGSRPGPTIPPGWRLSKVGDFNGDGYPDYVISLLNGYPTNQTAIWYMHDNQEISGGRGYGPRVPVGYYLYAVADFDRDGIDDYLLWRTTSNRGGPTQIFYIRNRSKVRQANGPPIPRGWHLSGAADFNQDGHPDYLLFTLQRPQRTAIWYLNDNILINTAYGPDINRDWNLWLPSGRPLF